MYYKVKIEDHIRVNPTLFGKNTKAAIQKQISEKYEGYISKELGIVIDVSDINDMEQGIMIPGDGAVYYKTVFHLLTFKPDLQEVVLGKIKDIADFGAFLSLGPVDGMIHISQTMDDFVSFSKDKVLLGKESKKSLKTGDQCRARIIAVSHKDPTNPKLGLTMRQHGLGKLDWIDEDEKKAAADVKKETAKAKTKKK
ncbi:DNA-directed RNA polymerase [Candidatus Woesearchaeota archaeon]|jgi:DNA-directed RNA polymerase subunit E'|nr:DNA-directed RNA polymerase [Candidatus Woesearchaeota archaeon]